METYSSSHFSRFTTGYEDGEEEDVTTAMDGYTYKRHLLNHMSYSHAYLSGASHEHADADPTALCEAAMHAAACAWCLADYHNEATPPEPIPAAAWEGIANRWIKAVEKWSKRLKANQAAAYAAPIRERAALKEFPIANGAPASIPSSGPGQATPRPAASGAIGSKRAAMRSSVQTTRSGGKER